MYLILFLCIPLVIALVLIKATEKRNKKRYEGFLRAVRDGSEKAAPQTAGFEIVMAQGAKDMISTVAGYERIQTGYASLPSFIVRYRENISWRCPVHPWDPWSRIPILSYILPRIS